ncbi:MAG: hypothetical protein U1D69_12515 [Polynucleobacter sp.]|nr:hypothetical protein [Polynucleobacter sp.]
MNPVHDIDRIASLCVQTADSVLRPQTIMSGLGAELGVIFLIVF